MTTPRRRILWNLVEDLVVALCGLAAFVGTLSLVAALTTKRPLPDEAPLAGGCATVIVVVIVGILVKSP